MPRAAHGSCSTPERERAGLSEREGVLCARVCAYVRVRACVCVCPQIKDGTKDMHHRKMVCQVKSVDPNSQRRVLINLSDNKVKCVRDCPALCSPIYI